MHVTNSTWFQSSLSDATLRITICLLCFLLLFSRFFFSSSSFTPTFTVLYTTVWHRNCLLNSNWCQWKVQYEHDPYDVIYNRDDAFSAHSLRSRSNSRSSEPLPFPLALFTYTNRCWKAQPSYRGGSRVRLLRFSSFPSDQNWPCASRGVQTVESVNNTLETFLFLALFKNVQCVSVLALEPPVSVECVASVQMAPAKGHFSLVLEKAFAETRNWRTSLPSRLRTYPNFLKFVHLKRSLETHWTHIVVSNRDELAKTSRPPFQP